jgi:uncharacterized protein (TIGR02145 family)
MKNDTTITSVADIDNNIYNVVKIGRQIWMQENLKVTRYRNGDLIGSTVPGTKDITNESNPKYQWPAYNSESNVEIFGRLYTWYAVTDSREICPDGWHVPTHQEWTDLVHYLGGINSAGGKLKEIGTTHWSFPNTGATNESGFSAIPGGYRNPNGTFWTSRRYDVWWSSTSTSALKALHWGVGYIYCYFYLCEEFRSQAVSVRCLKD